MDSTTVLLALSQFALALAGFTGVVISFGMRDGEWHAADSFRTWRALTSSLNAAFLAFVPILIELLGIPRPAVWRWSSAVFLLHSVAWMSMDAPSHWRSRADVRGVVPAWGPFAIYGGALAVIATQLLNVLGSWYAPQPGVFALGIVIYLLLPATIFARIPFVRPK